MGCFAVPEPEISEFDKYLRSTRTDIPEGGEILKFKAYRLLPAPVEFGFNRYVGDIRWRTGFDA